MIIQPSPDTFSSLFFSSQRWGRQKRKHQDCWCTNKNERSFFFPKFWLWKRLNDHACEKNKKRSVEQRLLGLLPKTATWGKKGGGAFRTFCSSTALSCSLSAKLQLKRFCSTKSACEKQNKAIWCLHDSNSLTRLFLVFLFISEDDELSESELSPLCLRLFNSIYKLPLTHVKNWLLFEIILTVWQAHKKRQTVCPKTNKK